MVGRMPTVTSQSSRATSAARVTARSKTRGRRSRGRRRTTPSRRPGPRAPAGRRRTRSPPWSRAVTARRPPARPRGGRAARPPARDGRRRSPPARGRRPWPASRATVSCSSERPAPVRSCRNFGDDDRDSGQRRVPAAAGRHDGPEVVDRRHGGHPRVTGPMTTFPQVLSGLLAHDPGRPARHLLRRRDRRAYGAVGHDVRQLGGEGRLPARRRARRRAAAAGSWSTCPPTGWRPWCWARPGPAGSRWSGRARPTPSSPDPTAWSRWAGEASRIPVVASALLPLAGRFPGRSRPASTISAWRCGRSPTRTSPGRRPRTTTRPSPGSPRRSCGERPPSGVTITDGGRLLSETSPASPSGLASFTEPLARSGSMVLVTHASAERRERIAADERVTARFDPGQPARS